MCWSRDEGQTREGCLQPQPLSHLSPPPCSPQPAAQSHAALSSLLPQRAALGLLPVLMANLGAAVRADRAHAWPAFRTFRTLYTPDKARLHGLSKGLRAWGWAC